MFTISRIIQLWSIVFVAFISILFIPWSAFAVQLSTPDDVVWHWFNNCSDAKTLTVEVVLDKKTIYKTSFSICQRRRDIPIEPEQKRLIFFIEKEKRKTVFGEPKEARIEGNIWKAGGDPDAIILGISFDTKEQIWLNTLHIAYPEKASESLLAKGLVIRTYPDHSGTESK